MKNVNDKNTKNNSEAINNYMYYSKVLEKPFESLNDLRMAEAAHFEKIKAKEDKAAEKKADAKKVEDAFKALNAARRVYKEDLATLTKEYATAIDELQKTYELGRKDIKEKLANAEDAYSKALKAFTEKYKDGYHLTLKDGDFETTISSQSNGVVKAKAPTDFSKLADLFDLMFRL